MRTTAMLSIMALAFLVAPALSAQDEAEAKSEGIAWTADYEAAKKTAKAENKRLFIEFTAEW